MADAKSRKRKESKREKRVGAAMQIDAGVLLFRTCRLIGSRAGHGNNDVYSYFGQRGLYFSTGH